MKTNNYIGNKHQLGIMEEQRQKKRQQKKREQEIKRKKIADLVAYGIEHEYKFRIKYKHDQFVEGLMVDRSKLRYMDYRVRQGVRQIIYWQCSDGCYCWELTDIDKQSDEYTISTNSNKQINQQPKPVVYIKNKYLKKFL